jgi:parallel beta-helix repeat protein
MNKTKKIKLKLKIGLIAMLFTISFFSVENFSNTNIIREKLVENNKEDKFKGAGYWNLTEAPIYVNDLDPNYNWSKTAAENDWCTGSGTWGDPYIIENVTIDSENTSDCIKIENSNVPFIIRNCTLMFTAEQGTGINLQNTDNGKLSNNTCSFNLYGIMLYSCDNNTILGNILNSNSYAGIFMSSGEFNNCTGNTINGGKVGFRLDYSQNNNIITNTINNADSSIWLYHDSYDNNISGNLFYNCGFQFYIFPETNYLNNIDNTNLANGKPIYYYTNKLKLDTSNFTNAGQIILINCNHSIISNLNLSHCSVGISLHFCNNISIAYVNSSYNSFFGFYLQNCNNITLWRNNAYYNEMFGVMIGGGKFHNLTENTMINCGIGLDFYSLEEGPSCTIDTTNKVNDEPVYYYTSKVGLDSANFSNAGQILLVNVSDSTVSDFEFSHCSEPISLKFCNNITISNVNTSYCFWGIYAYKSNNTTITGNNHMDHSGYGIYLAYGNYNTVSASNFVGNGRFGIYQDSDYLIISGNTINNNYQTGIYGRGDYSKISGNTIFHNCENGLESYGAYGIISGNNITNNNENGMELRTYKSTISGNSISNNDKNGIWLNDWAENNTLTENIIHYNGKIGLELTDNTDFNNIFNNEFIGNFINARDNGEIGNYWDNGEIGNYWDDYRNVDADFDGIGDVAYNISGTAGNKDNFPLGFFAPFIVINLPVANEIFGSLSPAFNVTVDETYLDSAWYTLDNGVTNATFTGLFGYINQEIWNSVLDGPVIIRFYARDIFGNERSEEVTIIKSKGFEPSNELLFITILVGAILGIGVIAATTFILLRRRKK